MIVQEWTYLQFTYNSARNTLQTFRLFRSKHRACCSQTVQRDHSCFVITLFLCFGVFFLFGKKKILLFGKKEFTSHCEFKTLCRLLISNSSHAIQVSSFFVILISLRIHRTISFGKVNCCSALHFKLVLFEIQICILLIDVNKQVINKAMLNIYLNLNNFYFSVQLRFPSLRNLSPSLFLANSAHADIVEF